MTNCDLTAGEVDQILIDLAAVTGSYNGTPDSQIWVDGTNATRTSASDAAVATLTTAHWIITE